MTVDADVTLASLVGPGSPSPANVLLQRLARPDRGSERIAGRR